MELYMCQKLSCDLKDDGRKHKELGKFFFFQKWLRTISIIKRIIKYMNNKMCFACLCSYPGLSHFDGTVAQNLGWNTSGTGFVLDGLAPIAQGSSSIRNGVNQIRISWEKGWIALLQNLQCWFEWRRKQERRKANTWLDFRTCNTTDCIQERKAIPLILP